MLSPVSHNLATLQSFVVALILIALLILRQSISGLDGPSVRRLRRSLNAIIVPLIIVFITQVVVRLADANAQYFEKHNDTGSTHPQSAVASQAPGLVPGPLTMTASPSQSAVSSLTLAWL